MNRTERLFALVLLLQNRPNMSSRDLSEHFGVSRRTVFRDLRALTESGVPLTYAEEGGYEILEGYQLPPLMLTAREAATLLMGTEFMKLQSDASIRTDADQVGLKIRSVLPREVREYIDRLREKTVLDPYWIHAAQEEAKADEGRWYKLSEAVARERRVIMSYFVESRGESTRRTVDPLGLVYYTDHWNLIAFDHLRGEVRNFRLDRIEQMHVLSEGFERPEGFDLVRHLEARGVRQATKRIRLGFREEVYRRAKQGIPARLDSETTENGAVTVSFRFDNLEYVANWLLRFGTEVDVKEPKALRQALAKAARAVAEANRS
ncbi:MAG: YafY family transcriptional regulator [Rhodothermales bacterium]|nr:YafY family transcriptional regulator [Rhodothermales bacterium]MBO6778852.1 YafY family transcriptional regulator [Rhodothermales bacterium]